MTTKTKTNKETKPNFAISLMCFLFVFSGYFGLPYLSVFGNDEPHYYYDFTFKLREDGRWVNFILHHYLRSISLGAWAVVLLAVAWRAFFKLSIRIVPNAACAAILSTSILLSYPMVEQSIWPSTTLPAVAILLFSAFWVERDISYKVFYIIYGILIFGSIQGFYFVAPLFYIGTLISDSVSFRDKTKIVFSHLIWWIAGAIFGVLFMSFFNYFYLGQFGVQVADWRKPQPIENFDGFLRNISYVHACFIRELHRFFDVSGLKALQHNFFFVLVIVIFVARLKRLTHAALILVAIILSFFALSIPLALQIASRSLIAMNCAILFSIVILFSRTKFERILAMCSIIFITFNYAKHASAFIADHRYQNSFFYEKIKSLSPSNLGNYRAVALIGRIPERFPEAKIFNNPSMIHPVIFSLGARDYMDCRQDEHGVCNMFTLRGAINSIAFSGGYLKFFVDEKNIAVIVYEEN